MPNTVSQAMHSGGVNSARDEVVFCCREWLAICEEQENRAVTTDETKYTTIALHLQITLFAEIPLLKASFLDSCWLEILCTAPLHLRQWQKKHKRSWKRELLLLRATYMDGILRNENWTGSVKAALLSNSVWFFLSKQLFWPVKSEFHLFLTWRRQKPKNQIFSIFF